MQAVFGPGGSIVHHPIGTVTLDKKEIDAFNKFCETLPGVSSATSKRLSKDNAQITFAITLHSIADFDSVVTALKNEQKICIMDNKHFHKGVLIEFIVKC